MDRNWYHRLLIGAVKHGEKIENSLKGNISEIDLTNSVSAAIPVKMFGVEINSSRKIQIVYGTVAVGIVIFSIFSLFSVGQPVPMHSDTTPKTQNVPPEGERKP